MGLRKPEPGVSIVTTRAIANELMETAGVHMRWGVNHGAQVLIGPIEVDRYARFFVIATLILGGADALMLAAIARPLTDGSGDVSVSFPGWEIV